MRENRLIRWCMFAITSLMSFGIDIGIFSFLYHCLFGPDTTGRLFWSVAIARGFSIVGNFLLNRTVVFRSRQADDTVPIMKSFVRYLALAAFVMIASYVLTGIGTLVFPVRAVTGIKVVVDLTLFAVSYLVQHHWVYRSRR